MLSKGKCPGSVDGGGLRLTTDELSQAYLSALVHDHSWNSAIDSAGPQDRIRLMACKGPPPLQGRKGRVCGLVRGAPSPIELLSGGRTSRVYEEKKLVKYEPWFHNAGDIAELAPVALETFGSYGKYSKVLEDVRKKAKTRGVPKDLWSSMFSDFSVILSTHTARSILSRLVTFHRTVGFDEDECGTPSEEDENSFSSWGE
eukprot:TRINITY_DN924_c0_g1_i20.p1 TRINITY_DN924_c0_g1~~TRINITY_DN924_c0_g1_i20.p1  ORF type:complete len:201 (+),score=19.90 TRINITY_DN924_c0_g1_i20:1322-1924(+)